MRRTLLIVGLLAAATAASAALQPHPAVEDHFFLIEGPEYREIGSPDFWDRYYRHDCVSVRAFFYDGKPPLMEYHCEG